MDRQVGKMNICIVGYGRMGREIEEIISQRSHSVTARIDPVNSGADARKIEPGMLKEVDMVIEFALSDGVKKNAEMYASAGVPAVVGTTGWDQDREKVRNIIEEAGSAYLWGSNFSIGAHIFFHLVNQASAMVDPVPVYDVLAYELHHGKKKDSPSGTALRMGEGILNNLSRKTSIVTEKLDRPPKSGELHVASVRGGYLPGTHTVLFDSPADTIQIQHTARNRSGFALGSVMAAEWLTGKSGFFQVEDFIQDILTRGQER